MVELKVGGDVHNSGTMVINDEEQDKGITIGPNCPFSIKLGDKLYEGKVWGWSTSFAMILLNLEIHGEKTWDYMKRNNIKVEDDSGGLWKFLLEHFEDGKDGLD